MIKFEVDTRKLKHDLERWSKMVGETGEQAVARYGVQVCRGLARQTSVWGLGNVPLEKQKRAIEIGLRCVTSVRNNVETSHFRALNSAGEVVAWVQRNRKGRFRKYSKLLPVSERKWASRAVFQQALRMMHKMAFIAKGGWIGAGMDIAKQQAGLDRINIGKNYLPQAAAHVGFGKARMNNNNPHNPFAFLDNNAAHTKSSWVLSQSKIDREMKFAERAVITRYKKIIERKSK